MLTALHVVFYVIPLLFSSFSVCVLAYGVTGGSVCVRVCDTCVCVCLCVCVCVGLWSDGVDTASTEDILKGQGLREGGGMGRILEGSPGCRGVKGG